VTQLLFIENFLDAATCAAMIDELRVATSAPAKTYGTSRDVEVQIRRTTAVLPGDAMRALIDRRLRDEMPSIASYFAIDLTDIEEPQFLRYQTGDFFVAHQDGNTPLVFDESRFRKISVVVFLSPQSEEPTPGSYGGGSLVLHGPYLGPPLRRPLAPAPGTLVAFRAETTHEVTPVTHGERFTIVSWYR